MDFNKVSADYLNELFNIPAKKLTKLSIKVLVLDDVTTPTLSINCSQTTLLENEIYLVENLKSLSTYSQLPKRETMRQLRCIVYISNKDDSVADLCKELQNPKYGEYQIFFNNSISKLQMEKLATNDHFEVVTSMINLYQDYIPLNKEFFYQSDQQIYSNPLNYLKSVSEGGGKNLSSLMFKSSAALEKLAESIASVILSLDVDVDIFFQKNSNKLGKPLALALNKVLRESRKGIPGLKTGTKDTCLLIIDRFSFDSITPLLQPWTYQSMINEYLGIERYIVDMTSRNVDILKDEEENKNSKDLPATKQQQQLVLNPKEDSFFAKSMFENYGDLNDSFQKYLEDYKFKMKNKKTINDLQDIKNFILQYPEFNKLSKNVTKHMAIISELDSDLKKLNIWGISELEQNIVTQIHDDSDYAEFLPDIIKILDDNDIDFHYKLKLLLIFGLSNYRYLARLLQAVELKMPLKSLEFVRKFSKQFQDNVMKSSAQVNQNSQSHAEGGSDLLSGLAKHFNKPVSSDPGVPHDRNKDNIYMQHHPALEKMIYSANLMKDFDAVDFDKSQLSTETTKRSENSFKNYIIYVLGGVTYEECRVIREFNMDFAYNKSGKKCIIGGTTILKTQSYLDTLENLFV